MIIFNHKLKYFIYLSFILSFEFVYAGFPVINLSKEDLKHLKEVSSTDFVFQKKYTFHGVTCPEGAKVSLLQDDMRFLIKKSDKKNKADLYCEFGELNFTEGYFSYDFKPLKLIIAREGRFTGSYNLIDFTDNQSIERDLMRYGVRASDVYNRKLSNINNKLNEYRLLFLKRFNLLGVDIPPYTEVLFSASEEDKSKFCIFNASAYKDSMNYKNYKCMHLQFRDNLPTMCSLFEELAIEQLNLPKGTDVYINQNNESKKGEVYLFEIRKKIKHKDQLLEPGYYKIDKNNTIEKSELDHSGPEWFCK